jgi:UPF0755 protein
MRWLIRLLLVLLVLGVLAAGAAGVWWWRWQNQPLALPAQSEPVPLHIKPGSSGRQVANALHQAGVALPVDLIVLWLRQSGKAHLVKAGYYEMEPGLTPAQLLDRLVKGEQALVSVTLIEGWNLRQVMKALDGSAHLVNDVQGVPLAQLSQHLGLPYPHLEGRLLPDTYRVARGASASSLLRAAASAMDRELARIWEQRQPGLPLRSADEALVLASIIEKETGRAADRPTIGGVFVNRLRIGMRLQTDPTVIYGLGESFDGNLRRSHLQTDNPYNTYTRAGLPPTPIAMPGRESLLAAVRPAQTRAMYFVARGDGSSQFSATLDEHNAAVRRYQLGQ